jgi:hypothetical protein
MKMKSLIFPVVLAVMFLGVTAVRAQETITNEEIISLTKAGLASSIIVGKIKTSKTNFDTSADALIRLKQNGVGDEVIAAMFDAKNPTSAAGAPSNSTGAAAVAPAGDPNDPMAKHNYGIYLYEEKDGARKMIQVKPTVSATNRTGGLFTNAMTYGIGKIKTKAQLPGRTSALQITTVKPVFYFYLDISSGGLNTSSGVPSDPNEFALVRFSERADNREVTIAKTNSFSGKGGLSGEYVVEFKAEDLGNGVFRITPNADMKKGEYGFYLVNSGNSNTGAAVGSKFFDFGVNPIP